MLIDWANNWGNGWESGTITLQAGQLYDITMWYDNVGWTNSLYLYLEWSYPGQSEQVIPQSQLYGDPACTLDNNLISNMLPLGGLVANLLGTPGEAGVTLSYELVPGDGSADNADFIISGNTFSPPCSSITPRRARIVFALAPPTATGCPASIPFLLYVYTPPTVANAIPNQYVILPNAFNYTVPANTFAEEQSAPLSYSATLADGSPLPAWLNFDPGSSTFSGTPDSTDLGTVQILVTAVDADNQQVSAPFTLAIYPPTLAAGQGLGLLGTYYNDSSLGSVSTDEIDSQVDYYLEQFPGHE